MRSRLRGTLQGTLAVGLATLLVILPRSANAQRDARPPAVTQGFDPEGCAGGCSADTVVLDVDRGRRAQPGIVNVTIVLLDTIALPKRGAPAAPRERSVPVWVACDSTACAAALVPGRISDKRLDDARVVRRTVAAWSLPPQALQRLARATAAGMNIDGRQHPFAASTQSAVRTLIESVRSSIPAAPYSPRAQLHVATFAALGIPGDSTMAEDVGTATEPLMIPDATTPPPTRVANLMLAGKGADAVPLLVQDDATGAAPIFGVGESVTIALPARVGRRGVIVGRIAARQRVEAMRDVCQGMKVWTYLVTLSAADQAAARRGGVPSPRSGEGIDRWTGTAVREPVPARMTPAEQRTIAGSRAVVAQFVRERSTSGVRDRDVQVLAALPRGGGFVTNFGVFARDGGGNWRFPTLTLRPATCPAD